MDGWWSRLQTWVLGDPSLEGLQSRVPTYEELHSEVQSILVPPAVPNGLQVNVMQPLNKSFAITHRMFLEATKADRNPLAALTGKVAPPGGRIYSLGGMLSHRFDSGAAVRVFSALDTTSMAKFTAIADPTGEGKTALTMQAVSDRGSRAGHVAWGAGLIHRGSDYAATLRAVNGPEIGVSYHQRLIPGSPISLGGEFWWSYPNMRSAVASLESTVKPVEWAFGAAYDTKTNLTSAHLVKSQASNAVVNLQHLYRVTDRSQLVAKTIMDLQNSRSMSAVGYRLKMRSTHTTVTGMADTYGGVKALVEREVLKDVRVSMYLHYNAFHPQVSEFSGMDDPNTVGLKVSVGRPARLERPLSPCTINRIIFLTN